MIYVLSDIHGRKDRFDDILRQIDFGKADKLYVLGDVIDRGLDGITLLQQIRDDPRMFMLLGNHEYMMLNAVKHPNDVDPMYLWYLNGGGITHEAYKTMHEDEKERLLNYLSKLPLNRRVTVNGKKFLLVHGAPADWYSQERIKHHSKRYFAVWTRMPVHQPIEEDICIIFGHTTTSHYAGSSSKLRIWKRKDGKMIGIDCSCAYGDYQSQLGCLCLNNMNEFYSAKELHIEEDLLHLF